MINTIRIVRFTTTMCLLIGIGSMIVSGTGCSSRRGDSSATGPARTALPSKPAGSDKYVEGVLAYQAGDKEKAYAALTEAVRTNPNLLMSRTILGELYRTDQQYEKATEQYEVLTRLDPYTAANHYNLGVSYQYLNRLEDAANSFLRALQLQPTDAKTNMSLGTVHLALGRVDDAVRFITQATKLDPKSAVAWANLGVALDTQGKYAEAEVAYRKSLDLNSKQNSTVVFLGSNLVTQNKPKEAIDVLRSALQQENSALARKRLADAYVLVKQWDNADKQYREALRIDANYYPALNDLGLLKVTEYKDGLELDDDLVRTAIELWKKSLAIEPEQPKIQALIKQWEAAGV